MCRLKPMQNSMEVFSSWSTMTRMLLPSETTTCENLVPARCSSASSWMCSLRSPLCCWGKHSDDIKLCGTKEALWPPSISSSCLSGAKVRNLTLPSYLHFMSYVLRMIEEGSISIRTSNCASTTPTKSPDSDRLANSDGGRLLIGVRDSGDVAGCRIEEEHHMIQCAADMHCTPSVPFESQVWKHGYLSVLEIKVPKSAHRPHFVEVQVPETLRASSLAGFFAKRRPHPQGVPSDDQSLAIRNADGTLRIPVQF